MPLTRQQIFDKVWERSKDKRKAEDPGHPQCLYRTTGPDLPKACFIGACIPDELYQPGFETKSVYSVLSALPEVFGNPDEDERFIRQLQCIHDDRDPESWEQDLRDFAHRWGVVVPE